MSTDPTGTAQRPDPDIDMWDAKIELKISQGLGYGSAVAALAAEDPALHERYLAAYNRRHLAQEAAARRGPAPVPSATIKEWENATSLLERSGMTKAQAVREVVNRDPDLHRRYLEAFNRL